MKVLRGNQIEIFKQKFARLDQQKRNLVIPNVKVGKDGTLSIENYSRVVEIMRLGEIDTDDSLELLS